MTDRHVARPEIRGYLRNLAGREYYVFKRRLKWLALIDGLTSEKIVTENHAIMMYNPLLTA